MQTLVPSQRVDLAMEFSREAAERTLMAWIRTSLSVINFAEVQPAALSRSASQVVEHVHTSLSSILLTSSPEPAAVLDRRGTVLLVNRAWRERALDAGAPLLSG